jgi:primosomal protein N' (replication factor Y) (superfamily II helicase)
MIEKTLYIFPKRGLYSLTHCDDCGHVFECKNCDANLTTYRKWEKNLELVCHQCQSYYSYPLECPTCNSNKINSKLGGIEELVEIITKESGTPPYRYDIKTKSEIPLSAENAVTTRIFDPSIPYTEYGHIIFIQAQNLLASPDYLVQEEITKALCELFLSISQETVVQFDTNAPQLELFERLSRLDRENEDPITLKQWFSDFLIQESHIRELYRFPPHDNMLLITASQKDKAKAFDTIEHIRTICITRFQEAGLPSIETSKPYPARFLRRKGLYSYHILIKYPRAYEQISTLRPIIREIVTLYPVAVRLNPKHVF